MKLFVELPTWMGDAVMATPAIENILETYSDCKLTLFGSFLSTQLFLDHPNVEKIIVDKSRKKGNRYLNLYRYAKEIGSVDLALSFRGHFASRFLLWALDADRKCRYRKEKDIERHQVLRYNDFVNMCLETSYEAGPLKLHIMQTMLSEKKRKILGINPGATYGSAKRWYPEKFARVGAVLADTYDIVIFGGPGEKDIAADIERDLKAAGVRNYTNLAGRTTIPELMEKIASLGLFITGDSGPMHLAAAFSVPTVSIFGPTRDKETAQWMNEKSVIVKKEMACAPCMKRTCPLKHHECMKSIEVEDILKAVEQLT